MLIKNKHAIYGLKPEEISPDYIGATLHYVLTDYSIFFYCCLDTHSTPYISKNVIWANWLARWKHCLPHSWRFARVTIIELTQLCKTNALHRNVPPSTHTSPTLTTSCPPTAVWVAWPQGVPSLHHPLQERPWRMAWVLPSNWGSCAFACLKSPDEQRRVIRYSLSAENWYVLKLDQENNR